MFGAEFLESQVSVNEENQIRIIAGPLKGIEEMVKKIRLRWKKIVLLGGVFVGLSVFVSKEAKKRKESLNINDDNPYIEKIVSRRRSRDCTLYEGRVKPVLDRIFSFWGLVLLSPLYIAISIAIFLDDPGPVFFVQKRVGKDGKYIFVHKFRSMYANAPADVPTHQLTDPKQYITRVGSFLRKTSLDEIPQIWDIFRGKMSVIGPRPALWNQEDLIAERERYGANSVFPGLTGLAQIRGRDELAIPDKARLDGQYVSVLQQGGLPAFLQDVKCLAGTVRAVWKKEGIVEGGTGAIISASDKRETGTTEIATEEKNFGFRKTFHIDKSARRKVLITGAGSYIGESFNDYISIHYPDIECRSIDMEDGAWRKKSFEGFDTVFHVAGIAHADMEDVSSEKKAEYYAVNTELAIESCQKAKAEGVKKFILMSSMIIYGEQKIIDEFTMPKPSNFYGDSKWQADKGVREEASEKFNVAVLRAPMVYGKKSKGNYLLLSRIAKRLPVFPGVDNKRSMLYIENLCEFVAQIILAGEGGIYFPQNSSYSNTSNLVKLIANEARHPIRITRLLIPAVRIASHIPGKTARLVDKAFGNSICRKYLSDYDGIDYQIYDLKVSIERTEG